MKLPRSAAATARATALPCSSLRSCGLAAALTSPLCWCVSQAVASADLDKRLAQENHTHEKRELLIANGEMKIARDFTYQGDREQQRQIYHVLKAQEKLTAKMGELAGELGEEALSVQITPAKNRHHGASQPALAAAARAEAKLVSAAREAASAHTASKKAFLHGIKSVREHSTHVGRLMWGDRASARV